MERTSLRWWKAVAVATWFLGPLVVALQVSGAQGAGESAPEALQLFQGAANLLQNEQFDLAVEEFDKLVARFPKDPLVPKARYYGAVARMRSKQWAQASTAFAAVIAEYPKFDLREDALLNLAWCRYNEGQGTEGAEARKQLLENASHTFRQLLKEYPQGKYRDQGYYFLGESLSLIGNYAEAAAAYREVVETFPQSAYHADSLYALGTAYEALQKWQEALAAYDAFLKTYPEHQQRHDVTFHKGLALVELGRAAEAEPLFVQLAEQADYASADYALYQLARCRERLGNPAEAASAYLRLVREKSHSPLVAEAELAAARCLFHAQQWQDARPLLVRLAERQDELGLEATHWLCRLDFQQKEFVPAESRLRAALARAGQSPWHGRLALDLADVLAEQPDKKKDALDRYKEVSRQFAHEPIAPQALYSAAALAWELQQYEEASALAQEFLGNYASDPLAADARRVIAECHFITKQYAAAEEQFVRMIAEYPEHPDRDLWRLRLANAFLTQGKHAQVVDYLRPLLKDLKEESLHVEAALLVAQGYFHQEQWDAALEVLQSAMNAYGQSSRVDEMLLWIARCRQRQGRHGEAISTLESLLGQFPQSKLTDQALYRLAESYASQKQWDKATELYQRALDAFPNSPWVPYLLFRKAWSEISRQEFQAAVEAFSKLLEKYPEFPEAAQARYGRAIALRRLRQFDQAVGDFQAYLDAVKEPMQRVEALYELALAFSGNQKFDEALHVLNDIIRLAPEYPKMDMVRYERAWTLRSAGRDAESLAEFQTLADQFPNSSFAAEANFHLAENHYQMGQYEQAVARYQRASTTDQGDLKQKALYKLGFAYFQLMKYQEAYAVFSEQVKQFADEMLAGDAWFMQGECLSKLSKSAEALAAYDRASQMQLSSKELQWLNLLRAGQVANELEKWDQAAGYLEKLLEDESAKTYVPIATVERASALYRLNRYQQAYDSLEPVAVQQSALGVRARFLMGEILFAQKKFQEAHREFRRAMYFYGGTQPPDEMKPWQVKAALEAGRCAEILLQQATTAQEKRNFLEEARKAYQFVTQRLPDSPEARTATARINELAPLKF